MATGAVRPPEEGRAPVSFLVDYDGTISLIDVGDELMSRHYGDQAELARLDHLYDEGKLGSRELMQWDMDVLPRDAQLLQREAAAMPQDPTFPAFVAAVRERGAQIEIVSDGFGFYVESNLAAIGVTDIFIATNGNRVGEGAAGMSFPFGHPTCFVCGTCKRERVRLHQAAGRVVVFIGDGTSDRFAAAHSDMVFAKGALSSICAAEGWASIEWDSFADVLAEVERAYADGRLPADADSLPGWRATQGHGPRPFICGPEVWGPGRTTPGPG